MRRFRLVIMLASVVAAPVSAADLTEPFYGMEDHTTQWDKAAGDLARRIELRLLSDGPLERGFERLHAGDLDTAMRRFNQSWVLCEENPYAWWGKAQVQFARAGQRLQADPNDQEGMARLRSAIALVDQAEQLGEPQAQRTYHAGLYRLRLAQILETQDADTEAIEAQLVAAVSRLEAAAELERHPALLEAWAEAEQALGNRKQARTLRKELKQLNAKEVPAR